MIHNESQKTLDEIEELDFSGIVLSPGPGIPENSGLLMALIDRWHTRVPILGICLGHQALGTYFGLELIKAPYPIHGKVSTIETINHPMWKGLPDKFDACRYHSLVISVGVSSNPNVSLLIPTATSLDDGVNMAIAHKHLPIWGIQFHPEAILTQYGIEILNNWLKAFILHK